ncbi:titin-like isoform X15, partial [Paramuricea clavata]
MHTTKIFPGNSPLRGVNTIFANWLNVSVIARHIRIEIQDSNDDPCLRLEVYGCGNVLPDVPGMPSISNIKSRLAVITWKAAGDYLESQLERYVIRVSYENYTMKINVTSDLEEKYLTYNLRNLTEYTFYTVSIAAGSAIGISNFTEEVTFLTLYGPYLFLKEQNLKIVEVNEKNITIPCTGRSYPTPRVIWKKDGKEIQSRENIIDASINSTEASNNSTEVSNNSTEASNNSTEVSNNSTGASNNFIYQISTPSRLDNKSNVSIEVTSTLFVRTNGIKYEDHGNYTCEVLNVNESSIPLSKTVEIQ